MEAIATEPDCGIWRLPLLTSLERERILIGWNQTAREFPHDGCIHELFEEQAKRSPQAVAVVFGDRKLSYGELERRAGRLAWSLRNLGVRVGTRVAVCMEPTTEMIVGFLAILKAGGAYVPIDPGYPQERISFMLEQSEPVVVLTRKDLALRFSLEAWKVLCLDEDWESVDVPVDAAAWECPTAGDLAYILFTSGSTGTPKGVSVPHRAVNRLVINGDYVRLGAEDVVAQISNCCFDAATFEIWGRC